MRKAISAFTHAAARAPGAAFFLGVAALLVAAAWGADDALRKVDGPCDFNFPVDHGAHESYRTEWWYYTGNLVGENRTRYGFQLTFFRTRLTPPQAALPDGSRVSAWRTPHIYLAHMAVTDIDGGIHRFAEDMARGALGLAGIARAGDAVAVTVKKWSASITPATHHLTAATEEMALDLILTPEKPPVAHGDGGYSRKGDRPDQASCYYSFTRLAATGVLRLGETSVAATGLAWMDHEFSTAPLDENLVGWDWFSLQLDDGTDIMLYRLRGKNGRAHAASSGTVVDRSGGAIGLSSDDFSIQAEDFWQSPETGGRYPVRWIVRIPERDMTLSVAAPVSDQEMRTAGSTGVNYWEGSVTAQGTSGRLPVRGRGYVEMTGYAGDFDAPL